MLVLLAWYHSCYMYRCCPTAKLQAWAHVGRITFRGTCNFEEFARKCKWNREPFRKFIDQILFQVKNKSKKAYNDFRSKMDTTKVKENCQTKNLFGQKDFCLLAEKATVEETYSWSNTRLSFPLLVLEIFKNLRSRKISVLFFRLKKKPVLRDLDGLQALTET